MNKNLNRNSVSYLPLLCMPLLLLSNCSGKEHRKDYILTERNLIPEGTAFDTRTQTIYVGSTFKRKIIQITEDGKITDFIPEAFKGVTSKLIGHQSSKVSVFDLNDDESEIVNVESLDSGDEFDSSTTGEIGTDYYYFIVNSQIRSGIDKANHLLNLPIV